MTALAAATILRKRLTISPLHGTFVSQRTFSA